MSLSNAPVPAPWPFVRGTEQSYRLTFTEPDGSPTPLDAAIIAFVIAFGGNIRTLDNGANGGIVANPDPSGVAIMTILPAHTAAIDPGYYRYYLTISVPGHGPYPEASGPFTLEGLP